MVQAAKRPIDDSNLYRDEGIIFDDDWINKYNVEIEQDENDGNEIGNPQLESVDKNNDNESDTVEKADNQSKAEEEIPADVTDTVYSSSLLGRKSTTYYSQYCSSRRQHTTECI